MTKTSEKKQITLESAIESLRNLVEKKGHNYVYKKIDNSTCAYFHPSNGSPSCGVGYVLHDHGWKYKDLKALGNFASATPANVATIKVFPQKREFAHLPKQVVNLLSNFQSRQDYGDPYVSAFNYAVSCIGRNDLRIPRNG